MCLAHVLASVAPCLRRFVFIPKYLLVMYPFEASGFTPKEAPTETLFKEKLVITAANALGVVPRSYTPPGYVVPEGDYNIAAGFLENGNQRYVPLCFRPTIGADFAALDFCITEGTGASNERDPIVWYFCLALTVYCYAEVLLFWNSPREVIGCIVYVLILFVLIL